MLLPYRASWWMTFVVDDDDDYVRVGSVGVDDGGGWFGWVLAFCGSAFPAKIYVAGTFHSF